MNYCYSHPKFMFYAWCLVLSPFLLAVFGPVSVAEVQKAQKIKEGNYITQGSFVGGEIADGLDVKSIRWAGHGDYERLVFDIYRWGGPNSPEGLLPNEYPGSFEVKFIDDKKIVMNFEGYRAFTAEPPAFEKSKLIKGFNETTELSNDTGYSFSIDLTRPAELEVFELHSPARVVLDLRPLKN